MVQLSLYSPKGNQALRHFPFLGYLGLTPLHVEGFVRTKIDDDGKLLPAKSITVSVRCYESRIGRFNAIHTSRLVDYTQVLWSKPEQDEWADIGDSDYPFRISIPTNVGGYTTANLQDYRVWWRVEAALTHIPLGSVGSRQVKYFDLPFIRYDIPPRPSTPPSPPCYLGSQTSKPRAPTIRYRVAVPTTPVGPQDIVSIPISLQPIEHSVSIRSASLIVERRIQLHETNTSSSSTLSSTLPIPIASSCSYSQSQSAPSSYPNSLATRPDDRNDIIETSLAVYSSPSSVSPSPDASTVFSDESARPLLSQQPPSLPLSPFKTITHSVAGVESSARFACDDEGVWTKTLTFQWPSTKSSTRWAMGETMQTDLASVKFFVRVKVIVSSPSGTESIELEEQELHVVSTNHAERQLALAKYNELLDASSNSNGTARSKSKSPRRTRRKREPLPSPPHSPPMDLVPGLTVIPSNIALPHPKSATQTEHSHHSHKSSVACSPYPTKSKKAPRRPHTSAGPRDNINEFRREANLYGRRRPDHLYPNDIIASSEVVVDGGGGISALTTAFNSFVRKRTVTPRSCPSGSSSASSLHGREDANVDLHLPEVPSDSKSRMMQTEAELSRTEVQNRRSSKDILGYFKRKRALGDRDG